MILYALHDYDKTKPGMFQINPKEAKSWNEKGYGIHWMPQVFKDGSRKTEDLIKIRFWLADLDNGDKETMLMRIAASPVPTTCLVETKRGYHCYWLAKNATPENYVSIERGIAEFFCADGSLITPTHTLRAPGFYHQKDPEHPFLIKTIWRIPENQYSEELMMRVFKPKPKMEFNKKFLAPPDLQKIADLGWLDAHFNFSKITDGNRNNDLNRIAYFLAKNGMDEGGLYQVMCDVNQRIPHPLDLHEIKAMVRGKYK